MPTALEILEQHHFAVRLDGDRLMVRAPRGALTEKLRAMIRERKPEIIDALRRRATPKTRTPVAVVDLPRIAARLRMDDGRAVYAADLAREFNFPPMQVAGTRIAQGPQAWATFITDATPPQVGAAIVALTDRGHRGAS